MRRFPRRALAAAPFAALAIAGSFWAGTALAKPPPTPQPDICHSRYLIACTEIPSGNQGTPGPGWHRRPGHTGPFPGMPPRNWPPHLPGSRVPLGPL